jgi:hypothetical protein
MNTPAALRIVEEVGNGDDDEPGRVDALGQPQIQPDELLPAPSLPKGSRQLPIEA